MALVYKPYWETLYEDIFIIYLYLYYKILKINTGIRVCTRINIDIIRY